MTREQIEKRIANEKKLRAEGYSNREIAEIMRVGYYTVLSDIGKEPQELREQRRAEKKSALASVYGSGDVYFPGSRRPQENKTVEEDKPLTPFAEAWRKAEEMHDSFTGVLSPAPAIMEPKSMRKSWIISDRLDNAQRAWGRVVNGTGVLIKQPEIQNVSMWFDKENKPWLTIVYSEVC